MNSRIHPTAIIEEGVEIGTKTAIWDHVHVRHGAIIGESCIVGEKTYIAYGVRIGNLVKINAQVYVCTGVTIEDGCLIAAQVAFTNESHPRATDRNLEVMLDSGPTDYTQQTLVRRGASIGAKACIGPGLTLGEFCMIGMGSVVTRDVPAHALMIGNPARLVGLVARDGRRVWSAETAGRLPPEDSRIDCPGDGFLLVRDGRVTQQHSS